MAVLLAASERQVHWLTTCTETKLSVASSWKILSRTLEKGRHHAYLFIFFFKVSVYPFQTWLCTKTLHVLYVVLVVKNRSTGGQSLHHCGLASLRRSCATVVGTDCLWTVPVHLLCSCSRLFLSLFFFFKSHVSETVQHCPVMFLWYCSSWVISPRVFSSYWISALIHDRVDLTVLNVKKNIYFF